MILTGTRTRACQLANALLAVVVMATIPASARAEVPLTGITRVTTGFEHSCALTAAGGVKCWGRNDHGQLGNGFVDATSPVDVYGLASGVVAIAAGERHTCAVTAAGAVKCWGRTAEGQLTGVIGTANIGTPIDVPGLGSGVVEVVAGASFNCALTSAGGVKCWGNGPMGNGSLYGVSPPVDVAGLGSGVTSIATGYGHVCAVAAGGVVKCWGRNDRGQLALGSAASAAVPTDALGLGPGVTAVFAGSDTTCAIAASGAKYCWGAGPLGDGTQGQANYPVELTELPAGVQAFAVGASARCALSTAGGVSCWGSNVYGQVGSSVGDFAALPVGVTGLAAGVTQIAAGTMHACAVVGGGAVRCWGDNNAGQAGNGTVPTAIPAEASVGLEAGVVQVTGGTRFSCALTGTSAVFCWGSNSYGQFGNGGRARAPVPTMVAGPGSGFTQLAAGSLHACGLTAAGGVKCWGYNYFGQLGNGSADSLVPVDVVGLASGVVAISAFANTSCALTSAGAVRCWGEVPGSGTPMTMGGMESGMTAVSAGYTHVCGLTLAGTIKCGGSHRYGQLGHGPAPTGLDISVWPAVNVQGISSGATAIASGLNHTCAVVNGAARCWGDNSSAQLGQGFAGSSFGSPRTVAGLNTGMASIASGSYHSCATTATGLAKCWGGNPGGGSPQPSGATELPVDVVGTPPGLTGLAAGGAHSCALTTAGGVFCWGWNSDGQIGNGAAGAYETPVAVVLRCAGFTDVEAASAFCPSVTWLKNREVARGCTASSYCPSSAVSRLAMAAFMNRLGNALAVDVVAGEASAVAQDSSFPLNCLALDIPSANHRRWAHIDAIFALLSSADQNAEVDVAVSLDGGQSWSPLASGVPQSNQPTRGTARFGYHTQFHLVRDLDVPPGTNVKLRIQAQRSAPLSSSIWTGNCRMRVRLAAVAGTDEFFGDAVLRGRP